MSLAAITTTKAITSLGKVTRGISKTMMMSCLSSLRMMTMKTMSQMTNSRNNFSKNSRGIRMSQTRSSIKRVRLFSNLSTRNKPRIKVHRKLRMTHGTQMKQINLKNHRIRMIRATKEVRKKSSLNQRAMIKNKVKIFIKKGKELRRNKSLINLRGKEKKRLKKIRNSWLMRKKRNRSRASKK